MAPILCPGSHARLNRGRTLPILVPILIPILLDYDLLTLEDVKALAPDIMAPFTEMAPTNTMFSTLKADGGVMQEGIRLLGKHHFTEGLPLAMSMYKHGNRPGVVGAVIKEYGGAARPLLPELRELQMKAPSLYPGIGEIIDAIENDKNPAQAHHPDRINGRA